MFLKQKLLKNKTCHVIHFFLVPCLGMDIGEGAGEVEPSNQTLTDWRRGQKLGGTWPVEKWKSRPCVANMVKPTSTEVSSSSFLRRNCWQQALVVLPQKNQSIFSASNFLVLVILYTGAGVQLKNSFCLSRGLTETSLGLFQRDKVGIFSSPLPPTLNFRLTVLSTAVLMKVKDVFGLKAKGSCTLKLRLKLEKESMRCSR